MNIILKAILLLKKHSALKFGATLITSGLFGLGLLINNFWEQLALLLLSSEAPASIDPWEWIVFAVSLALIIWGSHVIQRNHIKHQRKINDEPIIRQLPSQKRLESFYKRIDYTGNNLRMDQEWYYDLVSVQENIKKWDDSLKDPQLKRIFKHLRESLSRYLQFFAVKSYLQDGAFLWKYKQEFLQAKDDTSEREEFYQLTDDLLEAIKEARKELHRGFPERAA